MQQAEAQTQSRKYSGKTRTNIIQHSSHGLLLALAPNRTFMLHAAQTRSLTLASSASLAESRVAVAKVARGSSLVCSSALSSRLKHREKEEIE